jgi:cysteine desulfurase
MAERRAYLDHNASTPLRPSAAAALARALDLCGNPSSVHAEGRAARAAVEAARGQVAAALGANPRDVVFTSGATEALNALMRPTAAGHRLLALATEHSAALAGGGFAPDAIERLPVDADGRADLTAIEARLAEARSNGARMTLCVQFANSETGVIQAITDISGLASSHGAILICDAVAAIGKIEVDAARLGADAIVVSAHKFGGPKGVGAIVLHGGRLRFDDPLLKGGGQEMGRRSGTENVAGIAAMGAAIAEASAGIPVESARITALRDRLLAGFRAIRPDTAVFGERAQRLPNTLDIAVPGLKSETAVIAFDLAGVSLSSGSACSSGKVRRSHVLDAMGAPRELAEGALRLSLGWTTTEDDIAMAISAFARIAGGQAAKAA